MSETKETWKCEQCGAMNSANYCTTCGALKPVTVKEPVKAAPVEAKAEHKTEQAAAPVSQPSPSPAAPAPEVKTTVITKRSNPFATALLAGVIGLGAGFGGGYLAVKNFQPAVSAAPAAEVETAQPQTQTATQEDADQKPVTASAASTSIQEVAETASKTVVEIQTENTGTTFTFGFGNQTYTSKSAGSGVILSQDGYIITNNHVVEESQKITVKTYDGTEYEAKVIGTDEKSDIAVIKVEATGLDSAVLGDSDALRVGDTAIVIGNPLGTLGGTVTDGIISATNRDLVINNQAMNLIQTNAQINSGNSGGGLFNAKGELVGIVNAKDSGTSSSGAVIEGIGFAIPINTAYEIATDLMENGYVTNRATIGVSLSTVSSDFYDRTTGESFPAGLYIAEVYEGSGAETAGLKPYDRIVSAEGTEVSSYTDLTRILTGKKVGDTLELVIEREGETKNVSVVLTGPLESMNN